MDSLVAPRGPARVVLVEPHPLLRAGLKALMLRQAAVQVVGDFGGAADDLGTMLALEPDVVLTELALAGRPGVELLAEVHRLCPGARKLVLTDNDSVQYIRAALRAGADGYVSKDASSSELMDAIRVLVTFGERFLCNRTVAKILTNREGQDLEHRVQAPDSGGVTRREREVMVRIASGESNKAMARSLGLSPKTVEKHRANLMRKLRLHNAAAITLYVMQHGLANAAADPGRRRQAPPEEARIDS